MHDVVAEAGSSSRVACCFVVHDEGNMRENRILLVIILIGFGMAEEGVYV
jgi:hypothetical protein